MNRFWNLYSAVGVKKPVVTLSVLAALFVFAMSHADKFRLDASADALLLEDDAELKYFRTVVARYGTRDFLALALTPKQGDLFDDDNLEALRALQDELLRINGIQDVLSLLNAPLFRSPPVPLTQLSEQNRTLLSDDTDKALAKRELLDSPVYRELLLSPDGRSTLLLANYVRDARYNELLAERERLRALKHAGAATEDDLRALQGAEAAFSDYRAVYLQKDRKRIEAVRAAMREYEGRFDMFLGGLPMIVNDMIDFIQNDLVVFGGAVLLFLIGTIAFLFRDPRWVVIATLSALLPAAAMFGVLGALGRDVTVISSNFAALLLIIIMSMTVHIIVRYREMQREFPDEPPDKTIRHTMLYMFKPCIYTSLTTIVAFISLLTSGIRPVIDFGHMMSLGIVLAFVFVFVFLPNMLHLTTPRPPPQDAPPVGAALTRRLAHIATHRGGLVIAAAVAVALFSVAGATRLDVENRFIDYFSEETEVHRGMLKIDRDLGGTTPFDLVVTAPGARPEDESADEGEAAPADPVDDELGDLLGGEYAAAGAAPEHYWLNSHRLARLKKIHDTLEALETTGKVLSPVTLIRVIELINGGPLSDLDLAFIPRLLPDEVNESLLKPYLSEDGNEVRFNVRIIDSDPGLSRKAFLAELDGQIKPHIEQGESARVTGALVLYNNMLQSLYESQILTLGSVLAAILLMFIALFHSLRLAIIGVIPSTLAAGLILGLMGWLGIPLDLMTITIAAITIGIAVDNTIHYIVRFKREFIKTHDTVEAVRRCHGSIGRAVYYTSAIIVIGFSILALSNFTPTIRFGLLTGVAMLAALFATLTLLPALLILLRPLRVKAHAARP